jgi:hypothetical protein
VIRGAIKLVTVGVVAQKAVRKAAVLRPVAEIAAKQVRRRRAGGQWTHVEPPCDDVPAAGQPPAAT